MDDDRPLAIVDIDGVLADVRHRLHYVEGRRKDWAGFFAGIPADPPLAEGLAVIHELLETDHEVVLLTGRPERTRRDTERWLAGHGLPRLRIVMRRETDHRPARQVKRQLVRRLAAGRRLAVVVDDDPQVCAALEADGWPVLLADWATDTEPLHAAQEGDSRT